MSSIYPGYGNPTAQRCQRCGMPLSPNTNGYCGNCGMQNAPSQQQNASGQLPFSSNAAWGGGQPPIVQGNSQPGQAGQSSQFNPFGQFGKAGQFGPPQGQTPPSGSLGGTSAPQQAFGNQQPFGTPSAPQSSFNTQQPSGGSPASLTSQPLPNTQQPFGNQQPFNSPSASLQPFGNQQQPFAPPSQQPFQTGNINGFNTGDFEDPDFSNNRKKPKLGLIIGSVVLLIFLIGGGIGGYSFLKSHTSVPTASTRHATPTAAPKGPPLFSDSFQNNNKNWDLTSKTGEFSVAVGGGSLALEDDNNRLLWELLPGGKTYDNFLLNVDAVLSKGTQDNGYGVYIRGASNQTVDIATYYRFELYGNGSFAIFKGTLDAAGTSQSSSLVSNTGSSAILQQGKVNHISILAARSTLSLIVNGQLLKTITDDSYTSGSIALFVSNLANAQAGAQAKFSNLAIYPPQ